MVVPAKVTVADVLALVPLSPLLIFGWSPVPALGIAGGVIALLLYYLVGTLALGAYLWSSRSLLKPPLALQHGYAVAPASPPLNPVKDFVACQL